MSDTASKYITVFVPTYNGEEYVSELVEAVLHQELPDGYRLEFIVIDSGSKDGTVELIRKNYNDRLTLLEIPNSEFGHGKTRQKAAEMARGEYILFLSQDATPTSYRWLINMIEPFFVSPSVGCVFGRQIPRSHAVPTIKREVAGVFAGLGPGNSIVLQSKASLVDQQISHPINSFFSDVNSAIRKDLVTAIPFRDVKYAEDQALATDMQEAGYLKAYAPDGAVWHSNKYTAREYYYRKFDEYIGLQESVGEKLRPSLRSLVLGWIRPTIHDWKFTRADREYNRYVKLKFSILAPAYNFYMQLGKYKAAKYINDVAKRDKLSLESRRK